MDNEDLTEEQSSALARFQVEFVQSFNHNKHLFEYSLILGSDSDGFHGNRHSVPVYA